MILFCLLLQYFRIFVNGIVETGLQEQYICPLARLVFWNLPRCDLYDLLYQLIRGLCTRGGKAEQQKTGDQETHR